MNSIDLRIDLKIVIYYFHLKNMVFKLKYLMLMYIRCLVVLCTIFNE